ncbi:DUF3099 domain-containing protein [Streptomyces liangshanensis]|uniref:DUF3099 domain-containing protein n=1 Tax=Streptomyces liangshanensis TaxID=2717324 RepID=A0A6G9H0L1_9ACTN|nr:DUF3099 domain-containing protein [Streptomyces liangshanensis]
MYTRRRRGYFLLMGGCLILFVSAWSFVRIWSIPAAIGMCVVAMVIPPVAAIVGNSRGRDDHWWDEKPKDEPNKPDGHDDSWTDLGTKAKRRR